MDTLEILDAAGRGDLIRLNQLLDSGCDPNVAHPQYGNTPLSRACFTDRVEVVRVLLQRGADPNKSLTYHSPVDGRTEKGVVALMFARSCDVVSALLKAGADPNIRDADGATPLMRAVLATPPAAVEALLAAGADPLVRSDGGETASDLVKRRLEWLTTSHSSRVSEGQKRIAELERILAALGAGPS